MDKQISKAVIREKAILAIRRHVTFLEAMGEDSNPQVLEMVHRTQGQIDGIRIMLDALNGDMMMLNLDAKGAIG